MRKMVRGRLALCILIPFSILILPLLFALSAHASIQSQIQVVLNLYDQVCQGDWYGGYAGAPFPEWPKQLPCPGMGGDNNGFVQQLSESDTLENGNDASRAIETYPTMRQAGYIHGTFSLSNMGVTLQAGDHFHAKVGFVENMTAAYARFVVIYDPDPIESGDEHQLADITKRYSGKLRLIDVDLSAYAGGSGDLILRVETAGAYTQDRAVWVNARIQRPLPPTAEITPTLPPATATHTPEPPTVTVMPTSTATIPPSVTSTEIPEEVSQSEGCAGTYLYLEAEPKAGQTYNFSASAAPGCSLDRLVLWVNHEIIKECAGVTCSRETGPFTEGIHIFDAVGIDSLGNHVYPGNVIIEDAWYETNFTDYVMETCPLCPELIGIGECVSQTCSGDTEADYYTAGGVSIECEYESGLIPAVEYDFLGEYIFLFGEDHTDPYADTCLNNTTLVEHYCKTSRTPIEIQYECSVGCSEGACLPCQDSDAGFLIWHPGEIINDPFGREDYCSINNVLHEYFCSGNTVSENTVTCEYCANGACDRCEDTDGGINPWVYGVEYFGSEDYCWDEDMLIEFYNEITTWGSCKPSIVRIYCPDGCNPSIKSCNMTCSDGIQNGSETGVDCGGNCPASCMDCSLQPLQIGNGKEDYRFSLTDPVVLDTALDAVMEYADCLRDPGCKSSLDPSASILFKERYDEITVDDILGDTNAIMEAVAFYVTEHMGYVYDSRRPGNVPETQTAGYTILYSGSRGCLADKATTPAHRGGMADYCGDCEDHAILRTALLRALGVPADCVFCADHYGGYAGGGHCFNLVNYRGKWRIMDYHVLGWYFEYRWAEHWPGNVWNDVYGTSWCTDSKENAGECNKTYPGDYTRNYYGGLICPVPEEAEDIWDPSDPFYPFSPIRETYYTDTCP